MKIREYAKAIAALLGAVATFLVSVNAPAEWSVWIGSVVAILTGVATFGIPNLPAAGVQDKVVANLEDIQTQLNAARETAQSNMDSLAQQAIDNVTRIQQTIGQATGSIPVVGPLTQQAIDAFKVPRL